MSSYFTGYKAVARLASVLDGTFETGWEAGREHWEGAGRTRILGLKLVVLSYLGNLGIEAGRDGNYSPLRTQQWEGRWEKKSRTIGPIPWEDAGRERFYQRPFQVFV